MGTRRQDCGEINTYPDIEINELLKKINELKDKGATHIEVEDCDLLGYFERPETNEERIEREDYKNRVIRIQYKKRMS